MLVVPVDGPTDYRIEVSYGEVVKVINAVREKGVDKIGLVADKKKKGPEAAPAPAG